MNTKYTKLIAMLLLIVLLFSLSSCLLDPKTNNNINNGNNNNNNGNNNIYNNYNNKLKELFDLVAGKIYDGEVSTSEDGKYQYAIVDNVAVITTISNMISTFTIPENVNDVPITYLFPYAIKRATSLQQLTLSQNITSVGEYDYANNEIVGRYTCDIIIPNNNKYKVVDNFLYANDSIIGYKGSKNIVVPPTKSIDLSIFREDNNIETLNFSEGVQDIGNGNLFGLTNLKELYFSSTVRISEETSNSNSIYNCLNFENTNLNSINVSPSNPQLQSIDGVLFINHDSKLILARYPENKQNEEYNIPAGVTGISQQAFRYAKLNKCFIPKSVKHIAGIAFNSNQLKIVEFESIEVFQFIDSHDFNEIFYSFGHDLSIEQVIVPAQSLKLYKQEKTLSNVANKIVGKE